MRCRTVVFPDWSFAVSVILALTVLRRFSARLMAFSDLLDNFGDSFTERFAPTFLVTALKRWCEALPGTTMLPVALTVPASFIEARTNSLSMSWLAGAASCADGLVLSAGAVTWAFGAGSVTCGTDAGGAVEPTRATDPQR